MSDLTVTVFFNGDCPICRAEIRHYRAHAEREKVTALHWVDLAQHPEALASHGLTAAQAKRRLYTLSGNGGLKCGLDSFVAIWARLPRYRWAARAANWPVIRPLAAWTYDRLAVPLLAWLNRRREAREG